MKSSKRLLLIAFFLIAFALRIYHLTEIPPGLTHDEANHGREALGILDGDLRFYFPANYGSEPIYSYMASASMLVLGDNIFALRLVNVFFGLGAMGTAYLWAARAFDRRTALLAAGLTAVSFWPLASSREALRAGMLPFFMALAVWFFWQIVATRRQGEKITNRRVIPLALVIAFAVSIAITLHIYLAARVAWLLFPLFLLYLALSRAKRFRQVWQPVLIGLLLTGLMVVPMFVYLQNNPAAQTRLTMLDGPLQSLRDGNLGPVFSNAGEALLAFVWPGFGDGFLAYNIPGRPVFDPVTAVFFSVGLAVSFWRWRRPRYAFLLIWFGVGIAPSLLTGSTANTTRNLAALPAVYLLPAVGFMATADWISSPQRRKEVRDNGDKASSFFSAPLRFNRMTGMAVAWLVFAGWVSARDYFVRWADSPEVRGAYQHTLVEELAYIKQARLEAPVVISSVYPGPAHDPSISLVIAPEGSEALRWVDARYALLFPGGQDGRILIPDSTPIHPALVQFVTPVTAVSLRPDDLDPGFTLYELNAELLAPWLGESLANFDDALYLRAAWWAAPEITVGNTAEIITVWQVVDPARAGPLVPPFDTTDVTFFTQVLDESGQIVAQRDSLEAPSWDWQRGDVIIQVHPLAILPDAVPGSYQTIVGLYDKLSGRRLPALSAVGEIVDTFVVVAPLQVRSR
jgi:hypothetical protein